MAKGHAVQMVATMRQWALDCEETGDVIDPADVLELVGDDLDALMAEDIEVRGHKVFVFTRDGSPYIEMVNDESPLVRMTLPLLPDDAKEIAQMLSDAAEAV